MVAFDYKEAPLIQRRTYNYAYDNTEVLDFRLTGKMSKGKISKGKMSKGKMSKWKNVEVEKCRKEKYRSGKMSKK